MSSWDDFKNGGAERRRYLFFHVLFFQVLFFQFGWDVVEGSETAQLDLEGGRVDVVDLVIE